MVGRLEGEEEEKNDEDFGLMGLRSGLMRKEKKRKKMMIQKEKKRLGEEEAFNLVLLKVKTD